MEAPLSAKAALLQALSIPGYGLELAERVRRNTAGHVRLRLGSVYPALQALEENGLVKSRPGPRAKGAGRPRRYYELTPKGVSAAMAQRKALAGFFRAEREETSEEDVTIMRERLRSCSQLSGFILKLRRQTMLAARGRSR
jgi:DNA-binding PadR family transcriptional regulator